MRRFRPPQKNPQKTLLIIMIAVPLMILADRFTGDWHVSPPRAPPAAVKAEAPPLSPAPVPVAASESQDFSAALAIIGRMQGAHSLNRTPLSAPQAPPTEPRTPHGPPGRIAVIIDDLGMDRKRSNAMIDIDAPLTLAFLPYAPGVKEMAQRGKSKGHELLIHTPMEPLDSHLDPGPLALRSGMDADELRAMLEKIFNSFGDYAGINNHMGSRLTQDRAAMDIVMEELAKRDLFFVDSKTIAGSVAAESAAAHGLDYASRDVFLDNEDNEAAVETRLGELERTARRRGSAIAIGHPREATIAALRAWLPTLKQKGLTLVPVSALLRHGQKIAAAPASPAVPPLALKIDASSAALQDPAPPPPPQ